MISNNERSITMSKSEQGFKHGPILTPMEEDFGSESKGHKSSGPGDYNGLRGYPKGTEAIIPELCIDDSGAFGKVPKAKAKE
jgi:hypothetical protein